MSLMIKYMAKFSIVLFLALMLYVAILKFPAPLFVYHHTYKQFDVYSDRVIPNEIESVLQFAETAIRKSELYNPDQHGSLDGCTRIEL